MPGVLLRYQTYTKQAHQVAVRAEAFRRQRFGYNPPVVRGADNYAQESLQFRGDVLVYNSTQEKVR
jgi:hypothetical protein